MKLIIKENEHQEKEVLSPQENEPLVNHIEQKKYNPYKNSSQQQIDPLQLKESLCALKKHKFFTDKFKEDNIALKKLVIVTAICFAFMIGEAIGGYLSHSLAILTDAAHMFSDVASFVISYFAIYVGRKNADKHNTFGFGRAEILGAMASVILIWALVIWLLVEATHRIFMPEPIDGMIMLITACVGFICNVINLFTLHSCGEDGVP